MRRPWPFAAQAQQRERVRRIGVLLPGDENSPAWKNYFPLFARGLQDLGWVDGRTCAWMFVGLAAILTGYVTETGSQSRISGAAT